MNAAVYVDQLQREVSISPHVQRIISLVPSQTELLFYLGLEDAVVGITRFCIHPSCALKTKTVVGGTKKFNLEVIDRLNPDLLIGNKEENYKDGIDHLSQKYPVWMSDVNSLEQALAMIHEIGRMTNRLPESVALRDHIKCAFASLKKKEPMRVLYLIWKNPWMAVGSETFVHSLITETGWRNVLEKSPRYPVLTENDIRELNPDIILLSSEPFPFKESDAAPLRLLLPHARIVPVDGEMFSWYGSRLAKAPAYFESLR